MTPLVKAEEKSMLLSFRASNVRSFRDEFELSLMGTRLSEPGVERSISWRSGGKPVGVLPVAALFGANGSGKTNVLRAFDDMQELILNSFQRGGPSTPLTRHPFALDKTSLRGDSKFEVDVIVNGVRHEYGFVINDRKIVREWAFHYPKGRSARIFTRDGDRLEHFSSSVGQARQVESLLRPNALFLSTAAAANYKPIQSLYEWFESSVLYADASNRSTRQMRVATLAANERLRPRILDLLKAADLGISDVKVDRQAFPPELIERFPDFMKGLGSVMEALVGEPMPREEFSPELEAEIMKGAPVLRLEHSGVGHSASFDLDQESFGTVVWLGMIGPVIDALSRGSLLLADEIDSGLHPSLIKELVWLFQSGETNPHGAQLVFTSHDPSLLGNSVEKRTLGRDQVWFTEKLHEGQSRLFPLSDLDPRREESVERRYLEGRYGGIPIVSRHEFAGAAERLLEATEE